MDWSSFGEQAHACILRHKEPIFLHAAHFTLFLPSCFHVFLHARFAASSQMFQVSFLPRQFKTRNTFQVDVGNPLAFNPFHIFPPAPTTTTNNGLSSSEANGQNLPFTRCSPRNLSDDDTGTVHDFVPCTLPGLINEIMRRQGSMP